MNSVTESSMEDIPLDDEDPHCIEYRVLMAYAQRSLPASKYHQLLKRSPYLAGDVENRKTELERNGHGGEEDKGPPGVPSRQGSKVEHRKPTRRKSSWKKRLIPQCIRGEGLKEDDSGYKARIQVPSKKKIQAHQETAVEGEDISDEVDDANTGTVVHIVDRLLEFIPNTSKAEFRMMRRSFSLEVDGESDEDQIIAGIVALLRESGDRLEEQIKADKTLYQGISEVFSSYRYFKKVTDQYLGDMTSEGEPEIKQQSTKVAFAMDVTTKLTAIDNHPMNKVLGFGVKYLKENFSPWIQDHGGWVKAFGVTDQEEIE